MRRYNLEAFDGQARMVESPSGKWVRHKEAMEHAESCSKEASDHAFLRLRKATREKLARFSKVTMRRVEEYAIRAVTISWRGGTCDPNDDDDVDYYDGLEADQEREKAALTEALKR